MERIYKITSEYDSYVHRVIILLFFLSGTIVNLFPDSFVSTAYTRMADDIGHDYVSFVFAALTLMALVNIRGHWRIIGSITSLSAVGLLLFMATVSFTRGVPFSPYFGIYFALMSLIMFGYWRDTLSSIRKKDTYKADATN